MKKPVSKSLSVITAAAVIAGSMALQGCAASASSKKIVFSDGKITASDSSGCKISKTDLTIEKSGTYEVSGSCSDGSITVKKGVTGVELVLGGITLSSEDGAPICLNKSSGVTLTAKSGTVNTLSDTEKNNSDNYADNKSAENAVIKCKDGSNVVIGGTGTINISANGKNGIKSGETTEADGKASLEIRETVLNIEAPVNDAINAGASLAISSGTLNITAADDAVHSDYALTVGTKNGGSAPIINIKSCYEGLEGANITIESGDIKINATDDGINAANSDLKGYAFTLDINGGNICVNTEKGDGIDSNGTLTFNGGNTEIFATSSGANAPLDSDGEFKITGGTVFAVGNSSMAQTPADGSQGFVSFGSAGFGARGGRPGFDREMNKPDGEKAPGGQNEPSDRRADGSASSGKSDDFANGEDGRQPGMRGGRQFERNGGNMPPQNGENVQPPQNAEGAPQPPADQSRPELVLPDGADSNSQGTDGISIAAGDKLAVTDSDGKTLYSAESVRGANYVFYSSAEISDSKTYSLNVNGEAVKTSTVSESKANRGFGGNPPQKPDGAMPDMPQSTGKTQQS